MKIGDALEIVRLRMSYRPLTKSFHFTISSSPSSDNMITSEDSPYSVYREDDENFCYEWVVEPNGTEHFVGFVWYGGVDETMPASALVQMPTVVRRMSIQFMGLAEYHFEKFASAEDDYVDMLSVLTHELAIELKEIRRVK